VMGGDPTGQVSFTASPSVGSFSFATCTLGDGQGAEGAHCNVTYTDTSSGKVTITATYAGDSNNLGSTGSTAVTFR
jgi:hypothetical protein